MIRPPISLCLDDLKKVLKKKTSRKTEMSPENARKGCFSAKENTKYQRIVHITEGETPVLDSR